MAEGSGGKHFSIEFDISRLRGILDNAKDTIGLAVKYTAEFVWSEIRKTAPVDHGRLAGSFAMEEMGHWSYRIFSNVHYALFVHEGTGIYGPEKHRIVPRQANALSFFWKKAGKHMVVKSVAGMKGRPYADKAIESAVPRIDEFVLMAISENFKE